MATTNKKREKGKSPAAVEHRNHMGGQSFDITNPISRLRIAASSCFFGEPTYYQETKLAKPARTVTARVTLADRFGAYLDQTLTATTPAEWRELSPADMIVSAIDAALDFDPEATLAEASRLRSEENIRTTPQVILVRAANHAKVRGTGLIAKYAKTIVSRMDEPSVGLAYQLSAFPGKPIPNALKKTWRAKLEGANEYSLAKYRAEDRTVKTVDVVNLVHPKSDAVSKLVKGELKNTDQTWEAIISKEGSNVESWTKALDVMGHMAMLRNVRNLIQKGVDPKLFLSKLVEGAPTGKQLPFRYVSAYEAVKAIAPGNVQDAIEECLKASLGNLPEFKGRVMSLCDNSGSAQGATTSSMGTMKVSTIANLTGVLAGMRADEGYLGVFGDMLSTFAVRKNASVFDQLQKAETAAASIGQGTENGIWLFWNKAIKEKEHWDHVFVFSDMQAGHGGLYGTDPGAYGDYRWHGSTYIDVAKLIKDYRAKVNKNVHVYLVQVAGYQDTIVPEFYDKTYILGGWSDGLLRFAASMSAQTQGQ